MTRSPLEYRQPSTPAGPPIRRLHKALFAIAAVCVLVAWLLPASPYVRQDLGWIDAISGSKKMQTEWRFGLRTTPVITESPLARRYRKLGLKWTFDWRNVKGTYIDSFGRSVGHSHGSAPEIYSLAAHPELQRAWLAVSSDDEVRELFRIMTTGTVNEQRIAIEAVAEKALRLPEVPEE